MMPNLLTNDFRANVVTSSITNTVSVRSYVNNNRVQIKSVNWNQLAHQVEENSERISVLEENADKLEERLSATEDLVHLMDMKMIVFNELGD